MSDKQDKQDVFKMLQPGDDISITWAAIPPGMRPILYPPGGKVLQAKPDMIAVRSPAGYVFCVSRYHITTGTEIRVKKKGRMVS
ncbi:MAG: hypothetical protein ACOX2E_03340 [Syntrophaceticus sp.]|jgi:hypothetical protein